ncbi:hypothetical protein BDW72DRAFT_205080 [Aspergillus terricola var. indicus]
MASNSPDLETLFLREVELRKQAEERQQQAEKQIRLTTFSELIQYCHKYFSRPLIAEIPSRSTTGKIPPSTGKHCPFRFEHWSECESKQQEIYSSVCSYLEPSAQTAERLFSPLVALEDLGKRFRRAISSEQDLRGYERFGVENYVSDIITELSKIPAARVEDGIRFDNHANSLVADEADRSNPNQPNNPPSSRPSKPDQYCIHRIDDDKSTLLTTVEYKPPHKLSAQTLRAGLRPMDFWEKIVKSKTVPAEGPEKLRYNAARLTGSAVVKEYHVMIEEGLEYSYLTNGLALVLLRVDYDEPGTLYYHLCEPNMEINRENNFNYLLQPLTAISRILCLCLMSFRSQYRDQEWRNKAIMDLPIWKTSFDETFSQIPNSELRQILGSGVVRRGRKRGFSQVTSSPSSARKSARLAESLHTQSGGQVRQHTAQFCTQRCLLGLQQGRQLDDNCPNVMLHRQGGNSNQHLINADMLIQQLKQQLDENIDQDCTPLGGCGATGAPFKVTCTAYGYTMVGKGTTSHLWDVVLREAEVYRFLQQAQGLAVPVFLGMVNLAKFYFVHGAGGIRHMLIMAWAGEPIHEMEHDPMVAREIARSIHEIYSLGVSHGDLRSDNILWNTELGRAMIIDFHRSQLIHRATKNGDMQARTDLCCT